jgi:UDP-N-acetylglucosamine--N-acetylmuramyl-(pentapeptide) pyrophosphoryl-undecaprenol N-acetylglucosamine transferase
MGLDDVQTLWVGGSAGMEADLVKRAGVAFESIPAAGVHGVGFRALPGNLLKLAQGWQESGRILKQFKPDVLFFTGGYMAPPMSLAGRRIPQVLYVPDIEPGLALKTLARIADRIAVTVEDSRAYFPNPSRVELTGYPTRPDLQAWEPSAARAALNLSADLPTLLVFGGSKGARSLNRAILAVLPDLLQEMQIVHISGSLDWPEAEAFRDRPPLDIAGLVHERYRPFAYLHAEMGAALTVADLAVSRAGASALGEFPLFGLPAVLVPYPYAWRYQKVNAEYLAGRGAAVTLKDEDLGQQLLALVQQLMHSPGRRAAMRQAMRSLARPNAARRIASLLIEQGRGALPRQRSGL